MDKKWRPREWDNIYVLPPHTYEELQRGKREDAARLSLAYESGANTMLESLRARGVTITSSSVSGFPGGPIFATSPAPVRGKWVFIPDDEV